MESITLKGVFPAMVTPFDSSEQIDLDCLRREVEILNRARVDGLCVGGSIGEIAGATPEELYLVCRAAVSESSTPVLAGILPDCTPEALNMADAVARAGVSAVLVAPPHYLFSPELNGFMELFSALKKQVGLPLILSNTIPSVSVPLEVILKLQEVRLVDGVLQGTQDAHLLADLLNVESRCPTLVGVEDLIYLGLILDADGVVSALATILPEDCVSLYHAVASRDHERARGLHEKLLKLWRVLDHPTEFLSRVKCALKLRGRDTGQPRSPYSVPIGAARQRLENVLSQQDRLGSA